jgi:hypothetical protein
VVAHEVCGYETLSFTVWEEGRLTVFDNGVLRKICGPEGKEVTGGWRKLHNEEFYDYTSCQIFG